MSLSIWPPVAADQLPRQYANSMKRELEWILAETRTVLRDVKHGLESCYALLAPVEPGSTLVVTTPRTEWVKGTITRVGTRIVKGPSRSLVINAQQPIHIEALDTIERNLNNALDLLSFVIAPSVTPATLAAQLQILSQLLEESLQLLKGTPSHADPYWTTRSCRPLHFSPPLQRAQTDDGHLLSVYFCLQDCSILLWLRSLEPVNAHVHFGMKLGLAIGTVRRLEHDEMDVPFTYRLAEASRSSPTKGRSSSMSTGSSSSQQQYTSPISSTTSHNAQNLQVFVREKIRVESADPNLMSLSTKLSALRHLLQQTRQNLDDVLDAEGTMASPT